MNNDLNKLLKSVRVPDRSPGYWQNFPKRVTARLNDPQSAPAPVGHWRWAVGWAVAGIVAGLGLAVTFLHPRAAAQQDYAKLYREISTMFPNQVRAIVADEKGVRVVLADAPTVPTSSPVLVNICTAQRCSHVITFSGQQIPVGTAEADVLADGRWNIIVAGPQFVWSSAENRHADNGVRIDAQTL